MSFVCGINFRDTSGYVTDGTNETYSLGQQDSAYPISRGGFSFGWVSVYGDASRNRDNTLDRRLAGINFQPNSGTQSIFKLDLPAAGSYTIGLALGDGGSAQTYQHLEILDNTTPLFSITDTGIGAVQFDDAMGTTWNAAAWPASHVNKTGQVFATTTLVLKLGATSSQADVSTLAHLYVAQEVAGNFFSMSNDTAFRVARRVVGY